MEHGKEDRAPMINPRVWVEFRPGEVEREKSLVRCNRRRKGTEEGKHRAWPAIASDAFTRIKGATPWVVISFMRTKGLNIYIKKRRHLEQCSAHHVLWPWLLLYCCFTTNSSSRTTSSITSMYCSPCFRCREGVAEHKTRSDLGSCHGKLQVPQTIKYFWPSWCDLIFTLGIVIWQ